MQKFQNNVQDQFGNEITLPTITVRNVVGGALSAIFSDNGVTPLANPFIAQDLSEFFFYAANNRYDIFITGPVTDSSLDVLLFDPADGGVDASTFRTGNFLFDADVSASDPQADSIKFNNAVPASITSCRIALADIDNLLIADLTALSLVGSRMRVWDELDSTQLQEFVVRTVPALDVDHFEFTVDFIAGTASMPADDKRLRVQFELTSFLGAGITSNNQNSTLFWNKDKQWSGTDSVQVNPNTPEVGGRIRSPGSAVVDVSRAMVFHNVGNSIGGTLYAETEADQGFYLFADFNGSPRTWEFGYDSGAFNGILAFEDSPLGIVVFGAARYLQGEKSAAAADVVGFGQWWVRDDAPNTPMYTDDAGNDFELNAISAGLAGVNGAKAFGSANQAIATGSGLTAVALNSEAYDTDSIHDLVTNNSRLTVPAGIARIKLSGYVKWEPNGSSFRILKITKNGALGTIDDDQAGYEPDMFTSAANASVPDVGVFIDSGIIRAVATDFFELEVSQESGVSLDLLAGDYWFQMDLIEEAPPLIVDPDFSSVVLLLDWAGVDGGTDTTDLSNSAHVDTFEGNAQIDTAIQSPEATNSALFDGDNDSVVFPDSADWDFGTADFTIECSVRFASLVGTQTIFGHSGGGADAGFILRFTNPSIVWVIGNTTIATRALTPAVNTYHHIEISRSGTDLRIFFDGIQSGATVTDSTAIGPTARDLDLGSLVGTAQELNGLIGAVRITKGVARHTANFTPPTEMYPTS